MVTGHHSIGADSHVEAVDPARSPDKWAVVMVHGVGDNEPGSMLAAVTSAMQAASQGELTFEPYLEDNGPAKPPVIVRRATLPETDLEGNKPAEFPVFMRRGRSARGTVLF